MIKDHPIFTKASFRRALMASFAILLASFRVWAGPPVQFAAPTNSPIGTIDPIAIAAADLNGDGTMDLAVGSF